MSNGYLEDHIAHLDRQCASKKMPVRINGISPHFPKCTPLEPSRVTFINERWLPNNLPATGKTIQQGLLSFGGSQALIHSVDDDLPKILSRGQLWGPTSQMMKGRQSQCHENSALLWESNQDKLFLATGYALSDDGIWREHSWCILPKPRSIKVIETTEPRELYFGFVLTLDETMEFATKNTDMGVDVAEATQERYAFGLPETSGTCESASRDRMCG